MGHLLVDEKRDLEIAIPLRAGDFSTLRLLASLRNPETGKDPGTSAERLNHLSPRVKANREPGKGGR